MWPHLRGWTTDFRPVPTNVQGHQALPPLSERVVVGEVVFDGELQIEQEIQG
jgi:hypothetical protein